MKFATDHAASSHGQPVLVDADNNAYGPADPLDGATATDYVLAHLDSLDPAEADRFIRQWGARWAAWIELLEQQGAAYMTVARGFSCAKCGNPVDGPAIIRGTPPRHFHVSCALAASGLRNVT